MYNEKQIMQLFAQVQQTCRRQKNCRA